MTLSGPLRTQSNYHVARHPENREPTAGRAVALPRARIVAFQLRWRSAEAHRCVAAIASALHRAQSEDMPTTERRHPARKHRAACFDPEAPMDALCAECREVLRQLAARRRFLAAAGTAADPAPASQALNPEGDGEQQRLRPASAPGGEPQAQESGGDPGQGNAAHNSGDLGK